MTDMENPYFRCVDIQRHHFVLTGLTIILW